MAPLAFVGMLDGSLGSRAGASPASKAAGGALLGVSAGAIVTGIVLMAVGPASTLTTTSGQRLVEAPSIPLHGGLALTTSGLAF